MAQPGKIDRVYEEIIIIEELQRFELEPIFSDEEISEGEEFWELTSEEEDESDTENSE